MEKHITLTAFSVWNVVIFVCSGQWEMLRFGRGFWCKELWSSWVSSGQGYVTLQDVSVGKDLLSFTIFANCPVWVFIRSACTVPWSQHAEDGKSDYKVLLWSTIFLHQQVSVRVAGKSLQFCQDQSSSRGLSQGVTEWLWEAKNLGEMENPKSS